MVEEEAYYRYTRDHSQRQTHPGESRVDMARMSWAQAERGRGAAGRGNGVCKGPEAVEWTHQHDWRFQVKSEA